MAGNAGLLYSIHHTLQGKMSHNSKQQTKISASSLANLLFSENKNPNCQYLQAIKIFSKYGEAQLMQASTVLTRGISDVLHCAPMLPKTVNSRVINTIELKSAQFESMGDVTKIQNALQVNYKILDCHFLKFFI